MVFDAGTRKDSARQRDLPTGWKSKWQRVDPALVLCPQRRLQWRNWKVLQQLSLFEKVTVFEYGIYGAVLIAMPVRCACSLDCGCSPSSSWTLLHIWWSRRGNGTVSPRPFVTIFTGFWCDNVQTLRFVYWFTSVFLCSPFCRSV